MEIYCYEITGNRTGRGSRNVLGLYSGSAGFESRRDTCHLERLFLGFPRSLQENTWIVSLLDITGSFQIPGADIVGKVTHKSSVECRDF
jgi:hypothetical protein